MKNTPITQRVSSGLFGSKKEAPTTVAKQMQVGKNKKTTTVAAGDMILNRGKEKKRTKLYSDLDPSEVAAAKAFNLKEHGTHNPTKEGKTNNEIGTGEFEPDTYTQGPDKVTETKEFVPTQKRDKNRALAPWEVRMQSRAIKKSGRDMRKSQNKLDKTERRLKKLADKGITSGRKFDRLTAKQAENTSELDAFKGNMSARQRQAKMSASALMGDTYKSAQRNSELGDFNQSKQEQIIDSGNYKSNTTKKDPNDDPYGFKEMLGNVKGPAMKSDGFFKGKTALKKGYFK